VYFLKVSWLKLLEGGKQVHGMAVGVLDLGVALAPEGVPGFFMALVTSPY